MILITGASGYIGRQLTDKLIAKGYDVRLLARDNRFKMRKAEVVKGDILKPRTLEGISDDVDTLIHLAGKVSYKLSRDKLLEINADGTKNILKACRKIERVILASSVSVYAPQNEKPIDENFFTKPNDYYGLSKLYAEKEVLEYGIPSTILRIAPVYGIDAPYMINIMKLLKKKYPVPDVRTLTHLVNVTNVLQAFDLSLKIQKNGIYNVADDKPMPFLEFARVIAKNLGVDMRINHPWLVGFVALTTGMSGELNAMTKIRNYDISRARKFLKYKPKENIMAEIKRMVEAYRKK